jgi:hypothetical protein
VSGQHVGEAWQVHSLKLAKAGKFLVAVERDCDLRSVDPVELRAYQEPPAPDTAASIVADYEAGRLSILEAFKRLAPLIDGKGVTP